MLLEYIRKLCHLLRTHLWIQRLSVLILQRLLLQYTLIPLRLLNLLPPLIHHSQQNILIQQTLRAHEIPPQHLGRRLGRTLSLGHPFVARGVVVLIVQGDGEGAPSCFEQLGAEVFGFVGGFGLGGGGAGDGGGGLLALAGEGGGVVVPADGFGLEGLGGLCLLHLAEGVEEVAGFLGVFATGGEVGFGLGFGAFRGFGRAAAAGGEFVWGVLENGLRFWFWNTSKSTILSRILGHVI